MSLYIFPREAALIGCALQEYLNSWERAPCFLDTLTKRLRPFYPPVVRVSAVEVNVDDVPADISWQVYPECFWRIGFARSKPESWFFGGPEVAPDWLKDLHGEQLSDTASFLIRCILRRTALRFTRVDPTARNPLDIIAELVAPHVARSPADDARFNLTTTDAPWGLVQQRGFLQPKARRVGDDDEEAIEAIIVGLAPEDDRSEIGRARKIAFDEGRMIGGALAACETWQRELFHLLYIASKDAERFEKARADWRAKLGERFAELQDSHLLAPDGNAATCLRHLAMNMDRPRLDPERWEGDAWEWQDDVADEIRNLSAIRDAIWLAFGEILHGAEGAPEDPASAPRLPAPQMLRLLRLTEESTPDKIRGTLLYFQEKFEKGEVSVFPAQVVLCLGGAIESLARRIWSEKFTETHPEPMVSTVLQERLQHGDGLEYRFASNAMNLYKAYRNPSQHEFERFDCSLAEALHFFLGIRILLELSDAIEAGKRNS